MKPKTKMARTKSTAGDLHKLSEAERAVLSWLQLAPERSVKELSKVTGESLPTVQYACQRLKDAGLLRRVPVVNLGAMGFQEFVVLLSVPSSAHATLSRTLLHHPKVRWFSEISGEADYYVSFIARSPSEAAATLDQLRATRVGDIMAGRSLTLLLQYHLLTRGYLCTDRIKPSRLTVDCALSTATIDKTDAQILSLLREKGDRSDRDLASALKLGQTTFSYRVRRMKDQGIILGYYNYVDISSTQMHTTKFLIRTRGPARKHREKVIEWGEQHPRITLVREMFGSWDYELTAELDRSGDALELREEILALFQGPEPDVSIISLLRHFHRALLPLE